MNSWYLSFYKLWFYCSGKTNIQYALMTIVGIRGKVSCGHAPPLLTQWCLLWQISVGKFGHHCVRQWLITHLELANTWTKADVFLIGPIRMKIKFNLQCEYFDDISTQDADGKMPAIPFRAECADIPRDPRSIYNKCLNQTRLPPCKFINTWSNTACL